MLQRKVGSGANASLEAFIKSESEEETIDKEESNESKEAPAAASSTTIDVASNAPDSSRQTITCTLVERIQAPAEKVW